MNKIKLAILSAGLGHICRGFEVAASRLNSALQCDALIDTKVFCGGYYKGAKHCWNIPRAGKLATIGRFLQIVSDGCRLEQQSFSLGLIWPLLKWQPDVVWTQESEVGKVLIKIRKIFKLKFKILFCDGAPSGPGASHQFDYIQHLHNASFIEALDYGIPSTKMFTMPHWITDFHEPSEDIVDFLRAKYNISKDDFTVVSVAAWNSFHKRIDYLINEVSQVQCKDIKLILCGQPEPGFVELRQLGEKLMPGKILWLTLPSEQIPALLKLANVFVLASIQEGLPAALIESAITGVPTISHKLLASHDILGNYGEILDLSRPNNLKDALERMLSEPWKNSQCEGLRNHARKNFLDTELIPIFRKHLLRIADGQLLNRE
jgi:1,2-diacylglycerol 3-alpha-glucosyltransferase